MADVARLAGVSHQTVSRVLNDHPRVHPQTRQRVLEAIGALGYRRNTAARALVTRRTRTIGVVTVGSDMYGPASTLAGLQDAARMARYFVSLASMPRTDEESVQQALEHFMDQGVDGLVVIAPGPSAMRAVGRAPADVPVAVVASGGRHRPGVLQVAVDQAEGAALATRHLLGLGHRTVVHLAGPDDWYDARARVRGWRAALEQAGADVPEVIPGDWTPECGYEVGRTLLAEGLPTAVFAANDHMALGLQHALLEAGVDLPREVSIVGFDDVPGSAFWTPALTTVRQDFDAVGRRCLQLLLAAMDGAPTPGTALVEPLLVERASTAPPP
jgi:DNA-binding LacI/PurR family transcriptional regulator